MPSVRKSSTLRQARKTLAYLYRVGRDTPRDLPRAATGFPLARWSKHTARALTAPQGAYRLAWRNARRSLVVIGNFMARVRKLAGQVVAKCKTPPFSRPWMAAFVEDALRSANVPDSMARAKIGWGDYTRGRRLDPAFDLACHEIDLVVRQALLIQLESRAAAGDFKAAKLLSGGLAEIRKALEGQGVSLRPGRMGDDRFPGRDLDGRRFPNGPCLCCLSGLIVLNPWIDGEGHEAIVRHSDAENFYPLPKPAGWEDSPILYGISPDPGKLILDPESSGIETTEGEA